MIVTIWVLWLWVMGIAFTPIVSEGEYSFNEAIWWPLIVVKHALKGLWRVLFTEWKP
jgi:hypothetical protein